MIRHLVESSDPPPADVDADFEQLVYDMGHGSTALMHMIENDGNSSEVWWIAERLCEQARLLGIRYHQRTGGSDAPGLPSQLERN
jgi:hypothetical protein